MLGLNINLSIFSEATHKHFLGKDTSAQKLRRP